MPYALPVASMEVRHLGRDLPEGLMKKRALALLACFALGGACGTPATGPAAAAQPDPPSKDQRTEVRVNGTVLSEAQVQSLTARYRTPIAPGEYWYDTRTGLWGIVGGPAAGFLMPGEPIGGALQADASGGGTGVFVNGRELHVEDVRNLDRLFAVYGTRTLPGRYWSDANGNFGREGEPLPLGNFREMVSRAQRSSGRGSSYRNNPWSYTTDYTAFGSDGSSSYFESKKTYGADKGTTGVYIDEDGSVSYDR
jgi:hypothetical protein